MQFGLNESQQILQDSARQFFAGEYPSSEVRRLLETDTAFDATMWAKLAEQGYTGIIFPEGAGGVGLGLVELILLMEEAGRALLPGPFFSTVALAGALLRTMPPHTATGKYLSAISRGEARATVALVEASGGWDPADTQIAAANGRLTGEKLFVTDAAAAHWLLVVARNGVFLVQADSPGLRVTPMRGIDLTRKVYAVTFENTPAEKLCEVSAVPKALDIATAALCAEMVGGMQRALELTVEYAKTRKQFGKPVGAFQAVQHQVADMYLELESSRSATYYAAWALEENAPDAAAAVSIAKIYTSEASRTVGNRAIQVHGGMGFTWENDLHLFYRRAKASEMAFGDASYHRERLARLVIDGAAIAAQGA